MRARCVTILFCFMGLVDLMYKCAYWSTLSRRSTVPKVRVRGSVLGLVGLKGSFTLLLNSCGCQLTALYVCGCHQVDSK